MHDLVASFREFEDALSRGDPDQAASYLTDDAVWSGVSEASGKDAIRAIFQSLRSANLRVHVVEASASGNAVTARKETRGGIAEKVGVERVVFRDTVTFRGDKIARFVAEMDTSDSQTARVIALRDK